MSIRIAFYVQHLLGIGHVMRARRIGEALKNAGASVRLIMGGVPVAGLAHSDLEIVQLPAVEAAPSGFSTLVDAHGKPIDDAFRTRRRDMLLAEVDRFGPDIMLIEAFPFGRRQMRFELLPLLDDLTQRAVRRPLVACSLRDILQERTKPGRSEETLTYANRYFDLILVHGDDRLVTLQETFPLAAALKPRVFYTGIVTPPRPSAASARRYDIVVSAGGGAVGRDLMTAALGAALDHRLSGRSMLLLTGPGLADQDFRALQAQAPRHVSVERFVDDLPALLMGSTLSISQAGYNTIADILVAGCRAVIVPFARGGEREQTRRAEVLAAQGRVDVVDENALHASSLAEAAQRALQRTVASIEIAGNGAAETARLLLAEGGRR